MHKCEFWSSLQGLCAQAAFECQQLCGRIVLYGLLEGDVFCEVIGFNVAYIQRFPPCGTVRDLVNLAMLAVLIEAAAFSIFIWSRKLEAQPEDVQAQLEDSEAVERLENSEAVEGLEGPEVVEGLEHPERSTKGKRFRAGPGIVSFTSGN